MERNDLLHELHILHQTDDVVREQLNSGNSADAAWIQSGRMNVPSFHQTEHLARVAAHLQRLKIERPGKRIEGRHYVSDSLETMLFRMRRSGLCRLLPDSGVSLLHHLFAEVHPNEIVLEDIVVEHVFGSLAQVHDPLGDRGRTNTKRHILRVGCAGCVVIATDAADTAGNEVRVPRVLTLHEDAVAAEDRRSAVALRNLAFAEVDLCKDAEAAHYPGNRIPIHLHQLAFLNGFLLVLRGNRAHLSGSLS